MSGEVGTAAGAPPAPVAPPVARRSVGERTAGLVQRHGALGVLVIVLAIGTVSFDTFATRENLENVALQSSTLALIAFGMTFVIIGGGIDLSVGSVFALGGVMSAWASQYGPLAAVAVPLLVCGTIGLVNGLLVARTGMAPFIVTLASLLAARGLLQALTSEGQTTYLVPQGSAFSWLGQGRVLGIPVPVLLAVLAFLAGGLLLQRTRFGQGVFAVGGGQDAARLMGLPVARITVLTYVLSGALAGLAGAVNAARLSSGVTIVGVGTELDAIAAVVIGGTLLVGGAGTVSGTLCGVLLLGVIQNVINQVGSLSSYWQAVVSGAFLMVVVVVQTLLSRKQQL